ncbi:9175_t:CDS:1 [Acaulospora colombiana]|uniref:9175_t:CDS:1 n=1 Tax=Acaulospora colombiana TaxID=27376 RepID=A0ACA9LKE9_9GLOM|nr:9175_t:CDS:1 [Acaulospora colombiana]
MPLKVLVGTYNVNTQEIDQDLSSWLFPLNGFSDSSANTSTTTLVNKPDIIALGFQEFIPLPHSLLATDTERLDHCANLIERTIFLNTKESYTQLVKASYVGLVLFIYTRDRSITGLIQSYEISTAGVGLFWIGNKGGLGARIVLNQESVTDWREIDGRNINDENMSENELVLCFVVAHLAPHSHNTQRRNQDFRNICERLIFTNSEQQYILRQEEEIIVNDESLSEDGSTNTPLIPRNQFKDNQKNNKMDSLACCKDREYFTIYDSDFLFFFGDLNYRIELDEQLPQIHRNALGNRNNISLHSTNHLTVEKLLNLLHENQHIRLRNHDQLTREVKSGKVLNGFEEGELNFLPTYKFHRGSEHEFDAVKKIPGWCDRIFYFWHKEGDDNTKREVPIKLNYYISHPSYTLSDHKPVSAFFTIPTLSSVPLISPTSHDQLDSFRVITEKRPRTFNSPFTVDRNIRTKFIIGEMAAKVSGSVWWVFGTRQGIEVCLMSSVTLVIVWWMVKKFYDI